MNQLSLSMRRAVQETPESLAFEEELIQRFRLQDGKK